MKTKKLYFILFLLPFLVRGQADSIYTIEKLPISTKSHSEYNYFYTQQGAYFLSDRPELSIRKSTDLENKSLTNLYFLPKSKKKENIAKIVDINFSGHIGTFCVNQEGNYMMFTAKRNDKTGNYGLFVTEKQKGKWTKPSLIFEELEKFNILDPFFTKNMDTIIFVSDMAGGQGGTDLYFAVGPKGSWGKLINLGKINSIGDERYPRVINNQLYFSSNRLGGKGGMDIYEAIKQGNSFKEAVNLSAYNSDFEDFGISEREKSQFVFTSNRGGTDDLYLYKNNIPKFDCLPELEYSNCFEFSEENSSWDDTLQYKYIWDMGNGKSQNLPRFEYCYEKAGNYNVTLFVYDKETNERVGEPETYELEIIIPDQLTLIHPSKITVSTVFNFSVVGTEGAMDVNYYWDFGDGTFSYGKNVIHSFKNKGEYTISVGEISRIGGVEVKKCTSKYIDVN